MSDRELVKQKMDALIAMTDEFSDRYLNEEYKMLCRKLIQKMSRKQAVPFLSGRPEIWAAAIVYSLGQINFLFDKSFEPYIRAIDVCDYFKASQSTICQKSKKIRDMLKISYFDPIFSIQRIHNENPFNNLIIIKSTFGS